MGEPLDVATADDRQPPLDIAAAEDRQPLVWRTALASLQDGGEGSSFSECMWGTDCYDCAARLMPSPPPPPPPRT